MCRFITATSNIITNFTIFARTFFKSLKVSFLSETSDKIVRILTWAYKKDYNKLVITTYDNGIRKITFTISAGYVMIPEQGKEFGELYRKVDIALFTAK